MTVKQFKPLRKFFLIIFLALLVAMPFCLNNGICTQIHNEQTKKAKAPSDLQKFLDKLAQSESGGDYSIRNSANFLGKYQIGRTALKEIEMGGVPDSIFLNTPSLQEVAVVALLKKNKEYIFQYIKKYVGDTIKDVIITESGLIAAAYGTGAGSVMKFLDSCGEEDPTDGNGVLTSLLIKKYAGFKLNL